MRFYLVQRGTFNKEGETFSGINGIINLDNMSSLEFGFNALPNSFKRIMYNFDNYDYKSTGIKTSHNDELILFSNKDNSDEIIDELNSFMTNPYILKEYSYLELIPDITRNDKLNNNFWWCIDPTIDWMAFLNSNKELFEKGINNDYYNWWMLKDEETRKEEYKRTLKRWP